MTIENLVLAARAEDNFSTTLGKLKRDLFDIGQLEERVFDIDTGVDDFAETIAQLEGIESAVDAIDEDVTVDVDEDSDGGPFSRLSDEEIASVLDMESGFGTHVPTAGDAGGGGAGAAVTGGGRDTDSDVLDVDRQRNLVRRLDETFREKFDAGEMLRMGGITDIDRAIRGGIDESIDKDAFVRAFASGDLDAGILDMLTGDPEKQLDALDMLQTQGIADLPGEQSTMRRLQDGFGSLELKMGDFFRILASLLPLLINFVAAMPAAIAGIVALGGAALGAAGALAGIAGLGILGMGMEDGQFSMERVTEQLSQLRTSFIDAFGPLAERLEPLADDALGGMEQLFDALAARGDILLRMREDMRALGEFALYVIPRLTESLVALGDAAAPIFAQLGQWFANLDIGAIFADLIVDLMPNIMLLADLLMGLIPGLIQISRGFLLWSNALLKTFDTLAWMFSLLGPLGDELGLLAGIILTMVTVTSTASIISGSFGTVLGWLGIQAGSTTSIMTALSNTLIRYQVSAATAATVTNALTWALKGLLALTGIGLFVSIISTFMSLGDSISGATDQLKQFRKEARRTDGMGIGTRFSTGNQQQGAYVSVENNEYVIDARSRESANRSAQAVYFSSTEATQGVQEDEAG